MYSFSIRQFIWEYIGDLFWRGIRQFIWEYIGVFFWGGEFPYVFVFN